MISTIVTMIYMSIENIPEIISMHRDEFSFSTFIILNVKSINYDSNQSKW
jgi:hypothetical protein